jgi:hypothetical protein
MEKQMKRTLIIRLIVLAFCLAPFALGSSFTSTVAPDGTATYNGYYAWGSGASWIWIPGGSEAHYYSDCYPCYFWDNSRVYLEIALPSIAGNIVSATLYLDVTGFADHYSNGAAALMHQTNSSTLTGNAYNDRSLLGAGDWLQSISSPGTGWLALPVTNAVANDYANGYSYATFALFPVGNGYGDSLLAFTPPGGANSPYLEIVTDAGAAVPEPSSLLLFALGGAGLLLLRKRAA